MMIKGFISGILVQILLYFGFALIFDEKFWLWSWGTRVALFVMVVLFYLFHFKALSRDFLKGVMLSFVLLLILPVVFIYGTILLTGDLLS